jgi:hypothetical protein
MPGCPFPKLVRLYRKPWDANAEAAAPHSEECPVCGGDRYPGAYCGGCKGYAPFDEVLTGQALKAESERPRKLATAKHWLNEGESAEDIAAVLGLMLAEVQDVERELEAAMEGRKPGEKKFTPKGIRRANRRDRRALAARASA